MVRGGVNDFFDVFTISEDVLNYVGQNNDLVKAGYIYQLFTSIFFHFDILHFLSNCLFLLVFGLRVEERLFSWQYYIIFIVSGLMGGLLTLAVFGTETLSAGASGGVFGLLGVTIILAFEEDKRRSLWSYSGVGVIFLIITGGMNVNSLAHAIGLVTGILLPLFVLKKRKEKQKVNIEE
jgi:membrane associated rhomboid family serine protease